VIRPAALLFAAALLASCASGSGADAPSTTRAGSPSAPSSEPAATTTSAGIAVSERVIPLDGDVAEIVFALGLGDQVVATDLSATYPPEADALPQIGYQRALNAEPILEFDPTLVIGTDIAGPPEAIEELERVGVPVVIVPTPSDTTGPGTKIRAIAAALGVPDDGERLADEVESAIAEATPTDPANSPAAGLRVAMLYLRGSSTQLVFGEGTSIDWLIEATGAINVADEMGVVDTADITAEALIAAAPDVLLVTEDGLASVGGIDGLVALPSLAATPAAQHRAVLSYDAQLMLGNGPRTGDFLAQLMLDLADIRARLDDTNTDITDKETP
jgi:iron complex transport system substrate-binding protein